MALTKQENQVTWGGGLTASVLAGGSQTSDTINLDDSAYEASITFKADNSATPSSTDVIFFWLLQSSGDPDDSAAGNEFDTTGHAAFLAALDTNIEDPAIVTVQIPTAPSAFQIYAEGATKGSVNAITVSATISEHRAT